MAHTHCYLQSARERHIKGMQFLKNCFAVLNKPRLCFTPKGLLWVETGSYIVFCGAECSFEQDANLSLTHNNG